MPLWQGSTVANGGFVRWGKQRDAKSIIIVVYIILSFTLSAPVVSYINTGYKYSTINSTAAIEIQQLTNDDE